MKLPAILTLLLVALLGAAPLRQARGENASFDLFYGLLEEGSWYSAPEYGYVWRPAAAEKNDAWKPYTDGYWAQTDDGWTWVSYENFGWATYHYGRWTKLQDTGWVWVPGYDWGPGWVSWRTSDDYVGWAPLPPRCEHVAAPGGKQRDDPDAPITGVNYYDVESEEGFASDVDACYDLGPDRYAFVKVQDFGNAPLRDSLVPPAQNFALFQATANVTDTTYRRGPERLEIVDHGPNADFLARHTARPVRRLRLEHHDDLAFLRAALHDGGVGSPSFVRDDVLHVASPTIVGRLVEFSKTRPERLTQELAAPTVLHGWEHTGADPREVARVRARLRQTLSVASAPRRPAGGPIPAFP